jgi:uncharacterized Zn finger protein
MAARSIDDHVAARKGRGAEIAAAGDVQQVSPITWQIAGKPYLITLGETVAACTCPDFQRRGALLGECKHLAAARIARWARSRVATRGADSALRHAVTRLAWERDPFTVNCLKALALAAQAVA